MLGRVAENLYWLGRNLERAETIARLADVNDHLSVQRFSEESSPLAWDALLAALGAEQTYEDAVAADPSITPNEFLMFSPHNPSSLRSILTFSRGLARELRDHISREVFEELNQLYFAAREAGPMTPGTTRPFFATVKRTVAATIGLFDNTVLLTEGREWFRCGLFIERADLTSRVIDTKYFVVLPSDAPVGGPVDRYQWMAVLRSASALEAFRKRYRSSINASRVAELLMFDAEFPRSLIFSVQALHRHFGRAAAHTPPAKRAHAERELLLLKLELASTDAETVIRSGLHEFIDEVQSQLGAIDRAMTEHIFRAVPEAAR